MLVQRAKSGERAAFAELARRHLRAAFATAFSVVGNVADAEDLAQEGLLVAFERLDSCRDPERFSGWLREIVRNRALNAHAKGRVRRAFAQREVTPRGEVVSDVRARDHLARALQALTPMQREVVLLHDLDGWTHSEIAASCGVTEVASRQHLFTARKAMREQLARLAEDVVP